MSRFAQSLYTITITLWVGGLWTIGYLVAPLLFAKLGDRALAGSIAGQLFALMSWVGMGCAAYLIVYLFFARGAAAMKSSVFWLVILMLLFTLAGHFGVQPIMAQLKLEALPREVMDSILRDRFATWHGIASVLYLLQSLLGLTLVLRQNR
ncbi:MAG: hypothetical protein RIR70_1385 [Pseudomonadota bacterium]|jgi:hypothetical protein